MAFSLTAKKMLLIDRKFLNLYHSCLKLLFSYITKIQSHQNIKIKPVFVKMVSKIILVNVNEKYILCSHVNDRSKKNYNYYINFLRGEGCRFLEVY